MATKFNSKDKCKLFFSEDDYKNSDSVITDFYQPIIGAMASMIYFTLKSNVSTSGNEEATELSLLLKLLGIDIKTFEKNISMLEALSLCETYVKESASNNKVVFVLKTPLSAVDFMNNDLLVKMLKDAVGENEVNFIIGKYIKPMASIHKFKNVSSTFHDVFATENNLEKTTSFKMGANIDFDLKALKDILVNKGIETSFLKDKVLVDAIKNISIVYHLSLLDFANILSAIDTKKITYKNLKEFVNDYLVKKAKSTISNIDTKQPMNLQSKVSGVINDVISEIENNTPFNYFNKVTGRVPDTQEKNIIENIMTMYGITPAVANTIINYVFVQKNNKDMNPKFVEKISSSLKKDGIVTALQAINYFKKVNGVKEETKTKEKVKPNKIKVAKEKVMEIMEGW